MGSRGFKAGLVLADCEPKDWFVVFHDSSPHRWINWLAQGRFKHVSVFGKVHRSGAWVFYDFHLDRARICVVGDWEADVALAHYASCGTIVRFPRVLADDVSVNLRPGFWCVPAVAHILGIRSSALRPDALFRQCLEKGGVIVSSERCGNETEGAGRP